MKRSVVMGSLMANLLQIYCYNAPVKEFLKIDQYRRSWSYAFWWWLTFLDHSYIFVRPLLYCNSLSAKLQYMTDTGYGHVVQHLQRTTHNISTFATSQYQSPTSRHVKMLGCGKFLSVGDDFVVQQVVELLWARPLVVLYNMSVYSRCPCSGVWHLWCTLCTALIEV